MRLEAFALGALQMSYYYYYVNTVPHGVVEYTCRTILKALPKPKKTPGPPEHLRPIILLNRAYKLLSIITLKRIEKKIATFTRPCQAGLKKGRSCADAVWAQRMLASVVMKKYWELHKSGIDMSKAFDTIKRRNILEILQTAGCSNEKISIVRFLIYNTKLKVNINKSSSS